MIGMAGIRLLGEQMTVDIGIGLSYDDGSDEEDIYGNTLDDAVDWIPYIDFVWNF